MRRAQTRALLSLQSSCVCVWSCLCLQGVAKRVARPTSNIKSMLMGRGGDTKKKKRKKEVCLSVCL